MQSTTKTKIRDFLVDLDALLLMTLIISKGLLERVVTGDIVNVITLIVVAGLLILAELFFKGLLRDSVKGKYLHTQIIVLACIAYAFAWFILNSIPQI